ncbi:hypothetical protein D5086_030755 [Populus alba]|uniref:Uncharacterized protein n=1 Tax=Populus alba TaxID=43335 RepID=A0ACC4APD1_POPAL
MSSSSSKSLSLTSLSLFTPLHLSFLFLHLTILVTGDPPPPYVPLDSIALDCGSSSDSIGNARNWTADINSRVALLDQDGPSTNSTANGASTSSVPYHTARVSLSKFTYTFRVNTTGPKFVRLYFNPASYTGLNSALVYNDTIQLQYNHTRYAAPDVLYRNARTMGNDSTVNEKYNMTWEFPVHSTFTYLVRLHFCQFMPILSQKNDMIFQIYIANQTAERNADIISWADGYGVPIYKDYVVMMDAGGNEGIQNLSIALHPSQSAIAFDAMLNGAEIFKLSKSDNLSGPNPDAFPDSPASNTPSATSTKPKHSRRRTVAIIGAAVSGIVVVSFALQLQESVEEYVIGAQTEKEVDMVTPLKGSSIDDSSNLFSTGSELVVNSRILEMATTSSSDGQSFLSNESEKMMSGAVFSEIMNPEGR